MPDETAFTSFPANAASPAFGYTPEGFRRLTRAHPNRQRISWFRAQLNPAYDKSRARVDGPAGQSQWLHIEQTGIDPAARALVQGARKQRRYYETGQIEDGDIVITTMPDEYPLADHDQIIPLGEGDNLRQPNARVFTKTDDILVRGGHRTAGSGRVGSAGVVVTGIGTVFAADLEPGDVLHARGGQWVVVAVAGNEELTLAEAPDPPLAGMAFQVGRDRLASPPAVTPSALLDEARNEYVWNRDYKLSRGGDRIVWLPGRPAPAPGTRYSLRYTYLPKYQVMGDLGLQRGSVEGVFLPQMVIARLVTPALEARGQTGF